jgi:hypothetical protein
VFNLKTEPDGKLVIPIATKYVVPLAKPPTLIPVILVVALFALTGVVAGTVTVAAVTANAVGIKPNGVTRIDMAIAAAVNIVIRSEPILRLLRGIKVLRPRTLYRQNVNSHCRRYRYGTHIRVTIYFVPTCP